LQVGAADIGALVMGVGIADYHIDPPLAGVATVQVLGAL
jgi:hypothetical protein